MSELLISDQVTSLLGTAAEQAVRNNAGEYRCVVCDVDGDARHEDSAVVVLREENGPTTIRLAHARCSDSTILEVEFDHAGSEKQNPTVRSVAAIRTVHGKPQPWLLMGPPSEMQLVTRSGEMLSPSVTHLLEEGLHLVGSMNQTLPQVKGWRVEVDDRGVGQVLSPGSTSPFLDVLPHLPAGWRHLAWRSGWVTLVVGVDVEAIASAADPVAEVDRQALDGSTLGARVKVHRSVTRPADRPESNQSYGVRDVVDQLVDGNGPVLSAEEREEQEKIAAAGRELAPVLEQITRMRAGEDNAFTNAQRAVLFPGSTRVWPTLIPQGGGSAPMPAVVIDIDVDDENVAASVLQDCVNDAGFGPWSPADGALPFLSEWQYAAWASQILIMRTSGDDRDVLIFEAFEQASVSWYEAVISLPPGMAVIIANLHGDRPQAVDLLGAGSLLAGCIDGMGAGPRAR